MKMKFKNDEMASLIDIMSVLQEKGKLGYAIARNLRKIKEECTEYWQIRSEALEKYGVDAGNGRFVIPQKNIAGYRAATEETGAIEQEVDIFQVPEDTFINGTLTSGQMEALLWMVEGDDERKVTS